MGCAVSLEEMMPLLVIVTQLGCKCRRWWLVHSHLAACIAYTHLRGLGPMKAALLWSYVPCTATRRNSGTEP
jgi:hypothetical protein